MRKPTKSEILEFLRESNAIEGVYDEPALQQAMFAWQYLMEQEEISQNARKWLLLDG